MAEPTRKTTTEARAGRTPHTVRFILGISLALAVIGMAIVLLSGQ